MGKKKYVHRRRFCDLNHKRFPHTHHEYLRVWTDYYSVKIHTWECDFEETWSGPTSLTETVNGSRIEIYSKVTKETIRQDSEYPVRYIKKLVKNSNRNREIRRIELELYASEDQMMFQFFKH